jgi:hypothetical protein
MDSGSTSTITAVKLSDSENVTGIHLSWNSSNTSVARSRYRGKAGQPAEGERTHEHRSH